MCLTFNKIAFYLNYVISDTPHADPLPVLMVYGGRRCDVGEQLGDIIDVSDTQQEDCKLLKEIHID